MALDELDSQNIFDTGTATSNRPVAYNSETLSLYEEIQ